MASHPLQSFLLYFLLQDYQFLHLAISNLISVIWTFPPTNNIFNNMYFYAAVINLLFLYSYEHAKRYNLILT